VEERAQGNGIGENSTSTGPVIRLVKVDLYFGKSLRNYCETCNFGFIKRNCTFVGLQHVMSRGHGSPRVRSWSLLLNTDPGG
jgi:hypothetical protein